MNNESEEKREVLTVDRSTVQIYCFPVIFAVTNQYHQRTQGDSLRHNMNILLKANEDLKKKRKRDQIERERERKANSDRTYRNQNERKRRLFLRHARKEKIFKNRWGS